FTCVYAYHYVPPAPPPLTPAPPTKPSPVPTKPSPVPTKPSPVPPASSPAPSSVSNAELIEHAYNWGWEHGTERVAQSNSPDNRVIQFWIFKNECSVRSELSGIGQCILKLGIWEKVYWVGPVGPTSGYAESVNQEGVFYQWYPGEGWENRAEDSLEEKIGWICNDDPSSGKPRCTG